MFPVPAHVAQVLEKLEAAGFEAWCVGGCVRDVLLDRTPADWDVCTAATPDQTKKALTGFPTAEVGIRHGTVTALTDGGPVEVTTFRREGTYSDHRRPDRVDFSTRLEDDLLRRDFTINAMACHPSRGLWDCFGGQADLHARLLRCVGKPARRFEEDALRILRCLRFASVLEFSMEKETGNALFELADLLKLVSPQRVQGEMDRLLTGPGVAAVLAEFAAIIRIILPEPGEYNPALVQNAPQDIAARWAALLWQTPEAQQEKILQRLCFSNRRRQEITALLSHRAEPLPLTPRRIKDLLATLGVRRLSLLLDLFTLTRPDCREEIEEARAMAAYSQSQCLTLRQLAVSGRDLLELGFSTGPSLGAALQNLLNAVLEGELPNEREVLLERAAGELR